MVVRVRSDRSEKGSFFSRQAVPPVHECASKNTQIRPLEVNLQSHRDSPQDVLQLKYQDRRSNDQVFTIEFIPVSIKKQ